MAATTGEFRYLDPTSQAPGTKPWAKVDTSAAQSYTQTTRRRSVTDIRSVPPSSFGTDISGFSLYRAPAKETSFTDDASIRAGYYAEVKSLLKAQLPGVKKVVIFDHTIRKHDPSAARQPVQSVHVDQTPGAAEARVRRHIEDKTEAEKLLKGRFQIINVWRPISHPATDFPLALVDWRTVRPEDLIAVDLLYPIPKAEGEKEVLPDPEKAASTEGYKVMGETYGVGPSERHKFYYVKDMRPDEALFIKCFDSRGEWHGGKDGVAVLTPHTAFIDPQTPEGTKGRESIEVRCLVFYE